MFWNRKKKEETDETTVVDSQVSSETQEDPAEDRQGFFARLAGGMTKTRDKLAGNLNNLFKENEIDEDFYEELEEILVMSDIGIHATQEILERLKENVKKNHVKERALCRELLMESIWSRWRLRIRIFPLKKTTA